MSDPENDRARIVADISINGGALNIQIKGVRGLMELFAQGVGGIRDVNFRFPEVKVKTPRAKPATTKRSDGNQVPRRKEPREIEPDYNVYPIAYPDQAARLVLS